MRRGSYIQLILIGLGAGAIATAVAIFVPWMPTAASREAGRIDFVYWFGTVMSLFIFAVVMAVLVYAIINFRAAPDDWSDGPPVHGHTTLEVVWTLIPAILVTALAVVSAIVVAKNGHAGTNPLIVKVTAQQFNWQFEYPNKKVYGELRLPVDRPVKLLITANDVIHSFWVPEFAQKQDAVPGQVNSLVITPDKVNTKDRPFYPVICTELCGLGHAVMRSKAIVMTQAAYASWYKGESSGGASAGGSPGGASAGGSPGGSGGGGGTVNAAAVFTNNGCAACHEFKAVPGAAGKIGPSLDNLSESAKEAGKPLADFVHESIVEPDAFVPKGYQPGVMPKTFGQSLKSDELDALVKFITDHTN